MKGNRLEFGVGFDVRRKRERDDMLVEEREGGGSEREKIEREVIASKATATHPSEEVRAWVRYVQGVASLHSNPSNCTPITPDTVIDTDPMMKLDTQYMLKSKYIMVIPQWKMDSVCITFSTAMHQQNDQHAAIHTQHTATQ